jgi:hypothetical protein
MVVELAVELPLWGAWSRDGTDGTGWLIELSEDGTLQGAVSVLRIQGVRD